MVIAAGAGATAYGSSSSCPRGYEREWLGRRHLEYSDCWTQLQHCHIDGGRHAVTERRRVDAEKRHGVECRLTGLELPRNN